MTIRKAIKKSMMRFAVAGILLAPPIMTPYTARYARPEAEASAKSLYTVMVEEHHYLEKRLTVLKDAIDSSKVLFEKIPKKFDIAKDTVRFVDSLCILNPDIEFNPFTYERYASTVISDDYLFATGIKESSANPLAQSNKGASGLFQFRNSRWKEFMRLPFAYAKNPYKNALAARKSFRADLDYIVKKHPEFTLLTIPEQRDILSAMHNAGRARIEKIITQTLTETGAFYLDMRLLPRETRRHIKTVDDLLARIDPQYSTHTAMLAAGTYRGIPILTQQRAYTFNPVNYNIYK